MKQYLISLSMLLAVIGGVKMVRYPIGEPVPCEVYTSPFDAGDPAYKFFQTNYGEPNKPKMQAAPDDWIQKFGNNERTMLLHTISELRVVVAQQGDRILGLEKWNKSVQDTMIPEIKDPNEAKK